MGALLAWAPTLEAVFAFLLRRFNRPYLLRLGTNICRYQGLYGLRPTLHRLPYAGARNTLLGLEAIASALGPISHSLSGVSAFVKAVLDAEPWLLDPKSPEIPWRQSMADLKHLKDANGAPRKPVFGVMRWNKDIMPWPPVRRALDMTVTAMEKAGYESRCSFQSAGLAFADPTQSLNLSHHTIWRRLRILS
jgi:Asp-tRNA(Asn)/Glu-tRNA(Gln) amidotransferase A subunit family amidase